MKSSPITIKIEPAGQVNVGEKQLNVAQQEVYQEQEDLQTETLGQLQSPPAVGRAARRANERWKARS